MNGIDPSIPIYCCLAFRTGLSHGFAGEALNSQKFHSDKDAQFYYQCGWHEGHGHRIGGAAVHLTAGDFPDAINREQPTTSFLGLEEDSAFNAESLCSPIGTDGHLGDPGVDSGLQTVIPATQDMTELKDRAVMGLFENGILDKHSAVLVFHSEGVGLYWHDEVEAFKEASPQVAKALSVLMEEGFIKRGHGE